jgi:hypothetical protein
MYKHIHNKVDTSKDTFNMAESVYHDLCDGLVGRQYAE